MTSHDTQTGDDVQATATERDDEGGSFLRKHLVSGTASYAVGALSFVRAAASLQRSRRRAAIQAAVGTAWVAIGTLQRRMYERRTEAAEAADEPEMNGRDIPFEDQIDEAKETVEEAASETGLMGESEEEDEEQEAESEGEDEQETESESEDEQENESEGEDEQDVESEDSEGESTGTSTEELSSPEPSKDQPDADVPSTHVANEPGEAVGPSSTDAVPEELDADDVDEPGSMNEPDDEDAEEREADEGEETEE